MKKILLIAFVALSHFLIAQTEPTTQASSLNFSSIKTYKSNVSFTSNSSSGYLVAISESPITFAPVDNMEYPKGSVIGDAKITASGNGTFSILRNLLQNTTYHVAVFAYNSQGANYNYKSDNPLTGSFTTSAASFGNYYNGIDFTATDVINQLTNLIQPGYKPGVTPQEPMVTYLEFRTIFVPGFFEVDTVINGVTQKYVNCQYSNEKRIFSGTFSFVTPQPQYSREHRVAKSWYDFNGLGNAITDEREGADIHALDLVQNDVNTSRSNNPFGIVVNPNTNSYLEYRVGWDATSGGMTVAEPRDDRKGDIARAHFYMMLAYNGLYGENWGLDNLISDASDQDIQILLDWHYADLPDDFEKTRHEYAAEIQGNRNPLVDFPQLVDCIDFTNMTKKANCNVDLNVGIQNIDMEYGNFVYPNPSTGTLYFTNININDIEKIEVYNLLGVKQNEFLITNNSLSLNNLNPGIYVLSIQGKTKTFFSKFQLK